MLRLIRVCLRLTVISCENRVNLSVSFFFFYHFNKRCGDVHSTNNADGGGQYPKRQILRIARSQIGNEEAAQIKECV